LLQLFKGPSAVLIPGHRLLGALGAIHSTDLELLGEGPGELSVVINILAVVVAQAQETAQLCDGSGQLPLLDGQQLARRRAPGSIPQDVPAELHLPHEEMGFFWAANQLVFPQPLEHSSDIAHVVRQEFFLGIARRPHDDVINV